MFGRMELTIWVDAWTGSAIQSARAGIWVSHYSSTASFWSLCQISTDDDGLFTGHILELLIGSFGLIFYLILDLNFPVVKHWDVT